MNFTVRYGKTVVIQYLIHGENGNIMVYISYIAIKHKTTPLDKVRM